MGRSKTFVWDVNDLARIKRLLLYRWNDLKSFGQKPLSEILPGDAVDQLPPVTANLDQNLDFVEHLTGIRCCWDHSLSKNPGNSAQLVKRVNGFEKCNK